MRLGALPDFHHPDSLRDPPDHGSRRTGGRPPGSSSATAASSKCPANVSPSPTTAIRLPEQPVVRHSPSSPPPRLLTVVGPPPARRRDPILTPLLATRSVTSRICRADTGWSGLCFPRRRRRTSAQLRRAISALSVRPAVPGGLPAMNRRAESPAVSIRWRAPERRTHRRSGRLHLPSPLRLHLGEAPSGVLGLGARHRRLPHALRGLGSLPSARTRRAALLLLVARRGRTAGHPALVPVHEDDSGVGQQNVALTRITVDETGAVSREASPCRTANRSRWHRGQVDIAALVDRQEVEGRREPRPLLEVGKQRVHRRQIVRYGPPIRLYRVERGVCLPGLLSGR